jgi:hypothetical protein
LPESPKFLVSKKRFNEARTSINFFRVKEQPFKGIFDREVLETYGSYSPFLGGKRMMIQSGMTLSGSESNNDHRLSVLPAPKSEKVKA